MKTTTLALSLVVLSTLLCYTASEGAVWVFYGENDIGDKAYYDKESITSPSKGLIMVWSEMVYGRRAIEEARAKSGNKETHLAYDRTLFQMNCSDKAVRVIARVDHTSTGETIKSHSVSSSSWHDIPPESALEGLYKAVCPNQDKK